jgi:hypothetical protein
MREAVNQKYEVYCSVVVLLCSAVVATLYMAATRVCLHDVSLMLVMEEGAHGVEGGALGRHVTHATSLPHKSSHPTPAPLLPKTIDLR